MTRDEFNSLISFPVGRIEDNRMRGLMNELREAIADEDNPETLRKFGQSLKLIGDIARTKAYTTSKKVGRVW